MYAASLKAVFRLKLWLPFFILAAMQFLLLLLFRSYVHPNIYPLLSPLVELLGKNNADIFAQYPGLFIALPYVYQWARLILGMLFEGLAVGMTAYLFLIYFGSQRGERTGPAGVFSKWPQLAVAWAIVTAVILIINIYLSPLFRDFLAGSPRRLMIFDIVMKLIGVAVYALFIFVIPAMFVYGKNIFEALKTSLSLFFKYPVFTFFVVLIPYLFTLPITYLSDQSAIIAIKFTPELIFYILSAGLVVDMLVNFVMTGALVSFLLDERD